jgi:phospholipid/cholesterol/gamma-HCH transport system permease protein
VFLTVGRGVRQFLGTIGTASRLTVESVRALRDVRTWGPNFSQQARQLGVDSLPIGILIAGFTGVVLALLASYSFTGAVPRYLVGTLVQKTVMMELAPVLTGLALAGRVGANIAAEIGTMRVTEQVDALETLAYDPIAYLVVPRILAGTLMFPVVVGMAMIVGVPPASAGRIPPAGRPSGSPGRRSPRSRACAGRPGGPSRRRRIRARRP